MSNQNPSEARWYCLRTQVKREQIAAQHLRRLEGVEVFAPRLKYRKNTLRGRIWWVEPLFPGYLMARFDLAGMQRQVNCCTGVRGLVKFGREVPSIPGEVVVDLKRSILAPGGLETVNSEPMIEIGDEVTIADGPMKGLSGHIIEVAPAKERAKVLLEFLGESRALEVDILTLILPRKPLPQFAVG